MVKQTAGESVGQQALLLLRRLTMYGLLTAIPVAVYYYAVVDRQAQARVRLSLQALTRIQHEVDARLLRFDTVLRTPGIGTPGHHGTVPPAVKLRAGKALAGKPGGFLDQSLQIVTVQGLLAEAGIRRDVNGLAFRDQQTLAEYDITPRDPQERCKDAEARGWPKAGQPAFVLTRGRSLNEIEALLCGAGAQTGDKFLAMPASELLQAPAALQRFERVALVGVDGEVLASATPPAGSDPQALAHQPISASLLPTHLEPYLRKALRDRERRLAGAGDKVDEKAAGQGRLGEPQVVEAEIADQKFRLYLLPFAPEFALHEEMGSAAKDSPPVHDQLYLVGIQPRSTLLDASQALGASGLWYLAASVLLLLAALPLLRVLLIGETESAPRSTLAATAISLVLMPSIGVVVLLCDAATSHAIARWDDRARDYAGAVDAALASRLRQMLTAIDQLGPRLANQPDRYRAGDGAERLRVFQCDGQKLRSDAAGSRADCDFLHSNPTYCHVAELVDPQAAEPDLVALSSFDSLFLANADGDIAEAPYLSARGCQDRAARIPLANREYFRALAQGYGWRLPAAAAADEAVADAGGRDARATVTEDAGRYIAQRVYSRATGDRSLVLAVPRFPEDNPLPRGVFGSGSPVFELSAAVPPPLLGFAIVDNRSGTVVFHVDDDSSLQENFFHNIGGDPAILAAMAAGEAIQASANYLGVDHRFSVQPFSMSGDVADLPGNGQRPRAASRAAWSVVTWYRTADVVEPVVTAALIAVIGLLLHGLLLVSVAVMVWFFLRLWSELRAGRVQPWQWLWPQWRLRQRYGRVAAVLLGVLVLEILVWWHLTPGLAMLVTAPLLIATASGLSAWLAPTASLDAVPSRRLRWTDGVPEPDVRPSGVERFRLGYLACTLLTLAVTGVIPAAGLFIDALSVTQRGALLQGFEQAGRRFEHRVTRYDAHLRSIMSGAAAAEAVYFLPYWSALTEWTPTPGVIVEAAGDRGTTGTAPPLRNRSRFVDWLWPVAGAVLPSQIEAHEALERAARLARDAAAAVPGKPDAVAATAPMLQIPPGTAMVQHLHHWPLGDPVRMTATVHALDPNIGELLSGRDSRPLTVLRNVAALFLLLFAVAMIVRLVMARVLGIDTPVSPSRPMLDRTLDGRLAERVTKLGAGDGEWWYLLMAPDGTTPSADDIEKQLDTPVTTLDLAVDALAVEPIVTVTTIPSLLINLDEATLDGARRPQVLAYLEALVRRKPALLIVIARTPCWLRLCRPELFPEVAQLPAGPELARWQALQARFSAHQLREPDHADWLEPSVKWTDAPASDRRLALELREEGVALRELLGRDIDGLATLFTRGITVRSLEDFERLAIRLLDAHLRREWLNCSMAERVVLHAVAIGELPNPLNRSVLDDLLLRRLLVLAPEPRIASSTFRRYVLTAESRSQYAEWVANAERGTWTRIKTPVLIVLALLGAWLFYSFGNEFTAISAALGTLVTVLGNIGKVASFAKAGGDAGK